MKKTFRLAAVLVTLAALVMASCQNAAGGSGGGGGGGVTPTPTPPEPEAKSVTGDAIQLVGTYKLSDYSNLILNSDGTGSISFGASASTRSILLNDVEFTWEIDSVELEDVIKADGKAVPADATDVHNVLVPYLKFNLPEGSNIKIKALSDIYYGKYIAAVTGGPAASVKGTKKSIEGLALTLYKGGAPTTAITNLGDADTDDPVGWVGLMSEPFDEDERITSGVGIIGVIDIDNVKTYVTDDGTESGNSLEANPPKAADVVGVFELYSETTPGTADTADETAESYKLALSVAYNTINGFDAADISEDGEYTVASGKDKTKALPVLIPAVIDVKAGGGVADVTVVIFDGANITSETEFKDDEYPLVFTSTSETITVKKMALLADNPGFATGVIEGCRVEIDSTGKIGINKIWDKGGTTDYQPLFAYGDENATGDTELTPYIPFASIEKYFDKIGDASAALGTGSPDNATLSVFYKKAAVTN